ncbi:Acid Phosphatase [Posidoniimonas polymericola]|uniref:Acid Phosphatase n=1 Tax=Posidoniimonas polymericola TaxID=2528002 RepID=A0A5C5YS48_9BACT|nr:magnesium-dependent phosphatase-1 [Posidoniimonas polymericola]TWT77676.1 Acid Phosphatase [Posidoniimonas polymericola]
MAATPMDQPALIVFDLDFTLWDAGGVWCDCLTPPFRQQEGRVEDREGRHVRLYDDVPRILDECEASPAALALASRTGEPDWARRLAELLGIRARFAHQEIYPSSKVRHFAALREATGCDYDQMLFFDDEERNVHEVGRLGVTCVLVEQGMTHAVFQDGLERFAVVGRRTGRLLGEGAVQSGRT